MNWSIGTITLQQLILYESLAINEQYLVIRAQDFKRRTRSGPTTRVSFDLPTKIG